MYRAALEITTNIGCKNACVYCAQDKSIAAYRKRSDVMMMSYDTFKTCLDKIPPDVIINFSGRSECWLNPDCTRMLLYAQEKEYGINVLTTLVGFNPADTYLIETIPFVRFLIHLPSNEGYENITVDEKYLKTLNIVSNSTIKVEYMVVAGNVHNKVKLLLGNKMVSGLKEGKAFSEASTLAGNAMVKVRPVVKKLGIIDCIWKLKLNALLPNGDISLCCVDFGLKHILGNLIVSDYETIFRSEEFLRVKQGLQDPSLDTLCRYCGNAQNINMFAKIYNPLVYHFKEMRSFKDFYHNLKRVPYFLHSFYSKNKI